MTDKKGKKKSTKDDTKQNKKTEWSATRFQSLVMPILFCFFRYFSRFLHFKIICWWHLEPNKKQNKKKKQQRLNTQTRQQNNSKDKNKSNLTYVTKCLANATKPS